nr:hypothetical protein [Tanacetum cinerariifolium]
MSATLAANKENVDSDSDKETLKYGRKCSCFSNIELFKHAILLQLNLRTYIDDARVEERVDSLTEREHRLHAMPVVRSDPKMNQDYESEDIGEYFNKKFVVLPIEYHMESKYSGDNSMNLRPLKKRARELNEADTKTS